MHLTAPCSEFKKRQKANQVAQQKAEKAVSTDPQLRASAATPTLTFRVWAQPIVAPVFELRLAWILAVSI
eukprot:295030-Chlamydomonas_euryale.AAC.9